jgi:hypothetical protein
VGFLIAGVQKGGTYSLFRLLGQHPEIGLSRSKEVHFFDDEVRVDWSKPAYHRYHRSFSPRNDKKIFGEATPVYIYWPKALDRIKAYNPDFKIILLFRDPIGRAYSAWCHERRKGRDTLPFSEAIRSGRVRIRGPLDVTNRYFSYIERGLYGEQLSRALDLFPAANVLALDSREVSTTPSALVNRVAQFLGLTAQSATCEAVHANRRASGAGVATPSADDIRLLTDVFAPDLERFSRLVDFPIESWPAARVMGGLMSPEEVVEELAQPGFSARVLKPEPPRLAGAAEEHS